MFLKTCQDISGIFKWSSMNRKDLLGYGYHGVMNHYAEKDGTRIKWFFIPIFVILMIGYTVCFLRADEAVKINKPNASDYTLRFSHLPE